MHFKDADGNYGNDTEIHVRADKQTRRSYLKFDLSAVPAGTTVTSAKLYLYCTAATPADPLQVDVHETNDSWSEGNITWNNAPAVGALVASNTTVNGTGQYYYWDIASYAQSQHGGDKILSVVVKFPQDDPYQDNPNYHRDFASKEYNGTSCDPYLEITYTGQAPVASFTYSPSYPVCNETVTFNASDSYDPDGSIVSYQWDFGDGNTTTVNDPIITHIYTIVNSTINYTVTLTVTDNDGLTNSTTATVPVTNPAILRVSIPAGEDRTGISDPDPWLNECWLLNITGASETFTVRIEDVSEHIWSYDTHLVIALNDAAHNNLVNLTVNVTSIGKNDFKNGTLRPYNLRDWPSGDVYPTWFNDTLVNVGTIPPKGHVNVTVSVTFSNATGVRMHFDAYGSKDSSPIPPTKKCYITHNPLSGDSTVLFWPPPPSLSVSISPTSVTMDLSQSKTFTSSVSGGTSPYSYQWFLNDTTVPGANTSSWTFTPNSTGFYTVYLNVTDSVGATAKSNIANVTVNPTLTVSISPTNVVIDLGQSVTFDSTVSGGTLPYFYQWYLNGTPVSGATNPNWTFTPISIGFYTVYLNVSDSADVDPWATSNIANVTVNPTYTLTVNIVGGGSVNLNDTGPYSYGDVVELTAVPDSGWSFSGWSGDLVSISNPDTITMDDNKTVTATFTQIQYFLTVNIVGGGSVSKNPDQATYTYGTVVTLTATPDAGWSFFGWSGDLTGFTNPDTVTMDGDKTVTATFLTAPTPQPPSAVGGYALPITLDPGTSNSLIPQVGLASALSAIVAVTIILVRRRKKTLKREH